VVLWPEQEIFKLHSSVPGFLLGLSLFAHSIVTARVGRDGWWCRILFCRRTGGMSYKNWKSCCDLLPRWIRWVSLWPWFVTINCGCLIVFMKPFTIWYYVHLSLIWNFLQWKWGGHKCWMCFSWLYKHRVVFRRWSRRAVKPVVLGLETIEM
jgi:hypothetical protein